MARLCIPLDDELDESSAETLTRRLLNNLVEDESESDEFFDQWESRDSLAKQFIQELDESFTEPPRFFRRAPGLSHAAMGS